jgi:hypothetical protein
MTRPCVVICKLWPGWAWALEGLLFEVVLVAFGSRAGRQWLPGSCTECAIETRDLPSYVEHLTFIAGPSKFVNKILRQCEFGSNLVIAVEGPAGGLVPLDILFGHLVVPHDLVGGILTLTMNLCNNLGTTLDPDRSSCPRQVVHLLDSTAALPGTLDIPLLKGANFLKPGGSIE